MPFYTPINEVSFFTWAAGEVALRTLGDREVLDAVGLSDAADRAGEGDGELGRERLTDAAADGHEDQERGRRIACVPLTT